MHKFPKSISDSSTAGPRRAREERQGCLLNDGIGENPRAVCLVIHNESDKPVQFRRLKTGKTIEDRTDATQQLPPI